MPLLAVLTALVAGCSGGGGGGDKPTSLPSITSTPVASSPVPVPPAATPNTSRSLEAFVRFYFDQLNIAFSTADASVIRAYSDPICKTCNNYAATVGSDASSVIRGVSFALTDVAVPALGPGVTDVEVFGTVPPRERVKRDGTLVRRLPSAGSFHFVMSVAREGEDWKVASIGVATS